MANLMIEGIRWGDSTGIRIINKGIVDACVKQPVLNLKLLLTTESIWFLARWNNRSLFFLTIELRMEYCSNRLRPHFQI